MSHDSRHIPVNNILTPDGLYLKPYPRRSMAIMAKSQPRVPRLCKTCKQLYDGIGWNGACDRCGQQEENRVFHVVRDFLYDHPGAKMNAVAAHVGCTSLEISILIKKGRITPSKK